MDIDTGDFDYLILVIDILLNDEEPKVSKLESAIKTIINNIKNNTYKWYPTLDSNSIANLQYNDQCNNAYGRFRQVTIRKGIEIMPYCV